MDDDVIMMIMIMIMIMSMIMIMIMQPRTEPSKLLSCSLAKRMSTPRLTCEETDLVKTTRISLQTEAPTLDLCEFMVKRCKRTTNHASSGRKTCAARTSSVQAKFK